MMFDDFHASYEDYRAGFEEFLPSFDRHGKITGFGASGFPRSGDEGGGGAGGGASGKRRAPGGRGGNASSAPRRKMSSSTGSRFSKTPVFRFSTSSRDEKIYERSLVEGGRGSRPRPPGGLDSG